MSNPESKSRLVSLKLEQNPRSVLQNQLNSSSSKMQYTISKTNRFSERSINMSTDKFYDIPDTKTKRSASFGYGNKMDLAKQNFKTPSPIQYNLPSQFQTSKKKGITISAGRQIIKNNSVFEQSPHKVGPGQYNPKNPYTDHDDKKGYSLSGRNVDLSDKWTKNVPGPGNYSTLQLLDQNMKSTNSRVQNIRSAKFSKSKRSSDFEQSTLLKNPGPGQYDKAYNIDATAKYKANKGSHFSKIERKGIIDNKKSQTPGPGAYNKFSQFLH